MKIKIGTTLYLGEDSPYQLSSPIQGFESPAIRTGDGVYAGRDGGFVSGHFYGQRTLVFEGFYIGADCDDASDLRRVLFNLLRIRYRQPIVVYLGDNQYYTEGFVKDVKVNLESERAGRYQITFLCPDPLFYLLDGGTSESNTWYSTTLPAGSDTTISNTGGADIYPVLRMTTGTVENPVLTNTSTGKKIQLNISSTPITNGFSIDMKRRIIMLNGSVINSSRTVDSEWWCLLPGQNIINFSNTSDGILYYQKGEIGI